MNQDERLSKARVNILKAFSGGTIEQHKEALKEYDDLLLEIEKEKLRPFISDDEPFDIWVHISQACFHQSEDYERGYTDAVNFLLKNKHLLND